MDAAAALSFLEDLGDDEVAEFSDSDLEEGSDDDFENEYLYLGQDDDFVPPDEDDAEEDDSESDFHDGAVNRSPLAGRRRGRGIVARAAGDGARTPRGRGRGHGRGRAAAGAARGGRGRGRGRGRAAIVVESMWQNADPNPQEKPEFTPLVEAGPNLPADFDGTTELDFFKLYFTEELVDHLVRFTNAYADANFARAPSYANSEGNWELTTQDEMYRFLACLVLMGMCRFPIIDDYWSTKPPFSGSWARALISSRRRFKSLLAFFKVVDHTTEDPEDRLKKVRFLYESVRDSCSALFQPAQDISVDERIVRSKARYIFRQYLPNKPVRWGTKIFAACDSSTSYCFNYSIYTGQEINGQTDVGLTQRVVQDLTSSLHHQGHIVYTDNFYTSEKLATAMQEDGLQLVGTIKLNRAGVPATLKDVTMFDKYAERGDMRYGRNNQVLYVQWKDKRTVTMLSTIHSAIESVNVERNVKVNGQHVRLPIKQPKCIQDYNASMGGVDVFDQHVAAYRMLRKSNKYWKTIAVDQLEIAVVNSYILFCLTRQPHLPSKYDHHIFRRNLICQLGSITDDAPIPVYGPGRAPAAVPPQAPHLVEYTDLERNCKYCYMQDKAQRKTYTKCNTCNIYLHATRRNCFLLYHQH